MKFHNLRQDSFGAFAGALTTLPQAVAYGLIAVSPLGPQWAAFGITASVGTAILFGTLTGLFGSQPLLMSGPRAVTVMVFASAVAVAVERGHAPEQALMFAMLGLAVAGLFQFCAGVLRLGHAIAYVPAPVLAGFANASAVLVSLSALPTVLGAENSTISMLFAEFLSTWDLSVSHWALMVGGVTILATFLFEGRVRFMPAALSALVIGTAFFHLLDATLNVPAAPQIGYIELTALVNVPMLLQGGVLWPAVWADLDIVLLSGLSIGLLSSFDAVVCGGALALKDESKQNANLDLKVQGLANLAMGVLGFLPGSSALIRSTIAIDAGAKTRAANVGSALVFGVMLSVLAPLVAIIPLWCSAGMLLATSIQAIDKKILSKTRDLLMRRVLYPRVIASDIVITLTVVAAALAFGLIAAVGFGMLLSVVLFVLGMGRNPVRRTYFGSRVHSKVQRSTAQNECLEREGHRIAVIELQGALFFGSCASLQATASEYLDKGVEYLILDFRHLTAIDSTGAATLRTIHLMYAQSGATLCVSYIERERRGQRLKVPVSGVNSSESARRQGSSEPRWTWLNLEANGVVYALGEHRFYDDTDAALIACEDDLLKRVGMDEYVKASDRVVKQVLFEGLDKEQIKTLALYARRHRFEAGQTIFSQGDSGDRAYMIIRGRADVLIDIPGTERKKRVSALTEGSVFGEVGVLDGATRSATVTLTHPGTCLSIDAANFQALQKEQPDIVAVILMNLSRTFAYRLRLANIMISELEQ